ncbi:MAG: MATE family efflux transporter [Eubacterium sp.]
MSIQLSDHFTYKKLLRFVFPSIIMMIFTSIYSIVDGLFVSNYVGKTAFASVNLIMPLIMGVSALGFMIGTGGSAWWLKHWERANRKKQTNIFPFLCMLPSLGGILLSLLGIFLAPQVASL